MHESLSDEELMALYQTGEYAAFEVLYARHSSRIYEFLRAKSGNASDLLQETFLKLHHSRAKYSPLYPFLPWIFTIARNAWIDSIRLNEDKISRHSHEEALADVTVTEATEFDISQEMTVALKGLPEIQRKAIELRYLSDWSFEKIAADMNITPLNARQIISRGIKKLRINFGGNK